MKNFFGFLNSCLKISGQAGPAVEEILSIANQSPKAGVNLAQKGVTFFDFDDWLRLATKGAIVGPYSFSWRKFALQYPQDMAIKHLSLFLDVIKRKPLLADQAQAVIFSIPSGKLPSVKVIQNLLTENDEQARLKQLLIKKKIFGDAKFISEIISDTISSHSEGKVVFTLKGGKTVIQESSILESEKKKRCSTIFGKATVIAIRERHYEDSGVVRHFFFLVDGDAQVCKMREIEFYNIIRTDLRAVQKLTVAN
jgi:hypothetical protein